MRPFSADRPTAEGLFRRHWEFVLQILQSFGVHDQDLEDVAQTVFEQVHSRIESYDPAKDSSERAWLAGFARRCAKNHRSRVETRKILSLTADAGEQMQAGGLGPEQLTMLKELARLIPDDEQREIFVMRFRHGLTLEEIATSMGLSENAVKWRLEMAKKALEAEAAESSGEVWITSSDNAPKSGAYLGYGSLDALVRALRPRPPPPEVGAALWKRIEKRIREIDANGPSDAHPSPESIPPSGPIAPALPPAPALPSVPALPPVPARGPDSSRGSASPVVKVPLANTALAKMSLAALCAALAMVGAAPAGPGGIARDGSAAAPAGEASTMRAEQARPTAPPEPAPPAIVDPSEFTAPGPSTARSAISSPATSSPAMPSPSTAHPAMPHSAMPRPAGAPSAPLAIKPLDAGIVHATGNNTDNNVAALQLLFRMQRAFQLGELEGVLTLAADHERRFGETLAGEREAFRLEALIGLGRPAEAKRHARAVIAAHPRLTSRVERAIAQSLP